MERREKFQNCIYRLCKGEEHEVKFETFQLEVCSKGHPLSAVWPEFAKGQLILATRECQGKKTKPSVSAASESDTEESMAGSPLKLQDFGTGQGFVPVNAVTENEVCPTTLNEARLLLSLYNLSSQWFTDNVDDLLPLWVLCSPAKVRKVVCMGVKTDISKQLIQTCSVDMMGPFSLQSKDIQRQFSSLMQRQGIEDTKQLSAKCYARYNILGGHALDISDVGHTESLEVDMEWDKLEGLLKTPPLCAKTTVHATVSIGDMRSAVHSMYTELQILQGIGRGLKDGCIHWAAQRKEVPVLTNLKLYLEDLNKVEMGDKSKEDENETVNMTGKFSLESMIMPSRNDLDFTEQIWKLLKECRSSKELTGCFEYIFRCLQGGAIEPMVHMSNKSTLASLVREAYTGKMTMPDINNMNLLVQLLVECGVEKLCRDYSTALIGKELATESHLHYHIKGSTDLQERLNRLEKLQYCLELVAMLTQYLDLPRNIISIALRQALKHYESHEVTEEHTFTVQVEGSHIKSILSVVQPCIWRAELARKDRQLPGKTLCLFTENPTFGHVNCNRKCNSEESTPMYMTMVTWSANPC